MFPTLRFKPVVFILDPLCISELYELQNGHDQRCQNCHISKAAIDKPIYSLRIVFVLKCHILAYPNVNSQGCLAICVALAVTLKEQRRFLFYYYYFLKRLILK